MERIEPLLPQHPRRLRKPGRKRIPDRQVLCGILFVLYTAIPWEFLPQELGFGSGMTCWRRLPLACSLICLKQLTAQFVRRF